MGILILKAISKFWKVKNLTQERPPKVSKNPKLQDKTTEGVEEAENHKDEDEHIPTLSNESKDEDVASIFIEYKGNIVE